MDADGHNIDRFTMQISLGGSAMDSPDDAARALVAIAHKISQGDYCAGATSSLLDENGNRVGSWKFHLEGVN